MRSHDAGRQDAAPSNARATILDDPDAWFGFEQEYFLWKDGAPLGFPKGGGFPPPQGKYYTGVGYEPWAASPVKSWIRTSTCASTPGSTTKASTPKSPRASGNSKSSAKAPRTAADQMWIARYILMRLCEKYGVDINWHCKPLGTDVDWNGSGMHSNFSTKHMREVGGKEYFEALMAAFDKYKNEHIAVYGPDNHLRLTGLHETQSIDKFNYGIANRGASVRVPHSFVNSGYRGYLEDRRPNSQGDPYKIASRILQTIATVPKKSNGLRGEEPRRDLGVALKWTPRDSEGRRRRGARENFIKGEAVFRGVFSFSAREAN